MKTIEVEMRIAAGAPPDRDAGKVIRIEGDAAFVAWDTGVSTWCPLADCVPLDEEEND